MHTSFFIGDHSVCNFIFFVFYPYFFPFIRVSFMMFHPPRILYYRFRKSHFRLYYFYSIIGYYVCHIKLRSTYHYSTSYPFPELSAFNTLSD